MIRALILLAFLSSCEKSKTTDLAIANLSQVGCEFYLTAATCTPAQGELRQRQMEELYAFSADYSRSYLAQEKLRDAPATAKQAESAWDLAEKMRLGGQAQVANEDIERLGEIGGKVPSEPEMTESASMARSFDANWMSLYHSFGCNLRVAECQIPAEHIEVLEWHLARMDRAIEYAQSEPEAEPIDDSGAIYGNSAKTQQKLGSSK